MTASTYQQLRSHLAFLRLAAAAEALPTQLDAARDAGLSHTAFLERLLAVEVAAVEARRQTSLERFASLPAPWRLTDFDFDAQPAVDRKLVDELATLRFLDDATNVLLIGPLGVGKTMLAVGLAIAACQAGYSVYFTTLDDLVRNLKEAEAWGRFAKKLQPPSSPPCWWSTRWATCRWPDPTPTWSSSWSPAAMSAARSC